MTTNQMEYLSRQLDKVRAAPRSAGSHWNQTWLNQLERQLIRKIEHLEVLERCGHYQNSAEQR